MIPRKTRHRSGVEVSKNSCHRTRHKRNLEVKEEKDRAAEDWFSLVNAGKERSFQSHTYLVILRARTLKLQSLSVLFGFEHKLRSSFPLSSTPTRFLSIPKEAATIFLFYPFSP
ncbi:hypothetical protein NC651_027937 [Populus alba x Populus x berolinensis]|nr:hypothetical protein NC651_027937 [Populus alba x Populus x berolinensis]